MLFSRWKQWRRARYVRRHRIEQSLWDAAIAEVRAAAHLDAQERERLRALSTLFLRDKAIEAAGDLELTAAMRVRIACEACVPILNLDLDLYDGWYSVVVYPGEFVARHEFADEAGVMHSTRSVLAGEAWERGPVIVGWDEVQGSEPDVSVIIHEMAHKLDLLDGYANGRPPLHRGMSAEAWRKAFAGAFADFTARVDEGDYTAIDPYGAEDPGEFFAVASEAFFLVPAELRDEWPDVYEQLALYYRQQPDK